MSIAKRFITKELPKGYVVQKADQIDLLNRSLQFFKEKETFDIDDFSQTVLEQPEIIESFTNYKKAFEEEHAMEIDDSFTISQNAYKKLQRSYKRIIRLDKKIQIIIDGNRDHVEQGEDEKGKYYKVYYSSEDWMQRKNNPICKMMNLSNTYGGMIVVLIWRDWVCQSAVILRSLRTMVKSIVLQFLRIF